MSCLRPLIYQFVILTGGRNLVTINAKVKISRRFALEMTHGAVFQRFLFIYFKHLEFAACDNLLTRNCYIMVTGK
jgi:hypothetical protein